MSKHKGADSAFGVAAGSAWGILWNNGERKYLVHEQCVPCLFSTRRFARNYISVKYAYIKSRPDLLMPPHNWKMPIAVKVTITPNTRGDT
jgi:hypothetical protein